MDKDSLHPDTNSDTIDRVFSDPDTLPLPDPGIADSLRSVFKPKPKARRKDQSHMRTIEEVEARMMMSATTGDASTVEDDFSSDQLDDQWTAKLSNKKNHLAAPENGQLEIAGKSLVVTADEFVPTTEKPVIVEGEWTPVSTNFESLIINTRTSGELNPKKGNANDGIQFLANTKGAFIIKDLLSGKQIGRNKINLTVGETYSFRVEDDGSVVQFSISDMQGNVMGSVSGMSTSHNDQNFVSLSNNSGKGHAVYDNIRIGSVAENIVEKEIIEDDFSSDQLDDQWVSELSRKRNHLAAPENGQLNIAGKSLVVTADEFIPTTEKPVIVEGEWTAVSPNFESLIVNTRTSGELDSKRGNATDGIQFLANTKGTFMINDLMSGTRIGKNKINLNVNETYAFRIEDDGSVVQFSIRDMQGNVMGSVSGISTSHNDQNFISLSDKSGNGHAVYDNISIGSVADAFFSDPDAVAQALNIDAPQAKAVVQQLKEYKDQVLRIGAAKDILSLIGTENIPKNAVSVMENFEWEVGEKYWGSHAATDPRLNGVAFHGYHDEDISRNGKNLLVSKNGYLDPYITFDTPTYVHAFSLEQMAGGDTAWVRITYEDGSMHRENVGGGGTFLVNAKVTKIFYDRGRSDAAFGFRDVIIAESSAAQEEEEHKAIDALFSDPDAVAHILPPQHAEATTPQPTYEELQENIDQIKTAILERGMEARILEQSTTETFDVWDPDTMVNIRGTSSISGGQLYVGAASMVQLTQVPIRQQGQEKITTMHVEVGGDRFMWRSGATQENEYAGQAVDIIANKYVGMTGPQGDSHPHAYYVNGVYTIVETENDDGIKLVITDPNGKQYNFSYGLHEAGTEAQPTLYSGRGSYIEDITFEVYSDKTLIEQLGEAQQHLVNLYTQIVSEQAGMPTIQAGDTPEQRKQSLQEKKEYLQNQINVLTLQQIAVQNNNGTAQELEDLQNQINTLKQQLVPYSAMHVSPDPLHSNTSVVQFMSNHTQTYFEVRMDGQPGMVYTRTIEHPTGEQNGMTEFNIGSVYNGVNGYGNKFDIYMYSDSSKTVLLDSIHGHYTDGVAVAQSNGEWGTLETGRTVENPVTPLLSIEKISGPNILVSYQSPYDSTNLYLEGGGFFNSLSVSHEGGAGMGTAMLTFNGDNRAWNYKLQMREGRNGRVIAEATFAWDPSTKSLSLVSDDVKLTTLHTDETKQMLQDQMEMFDKETSIESLNVSFSQLSDIFGRRLYAESSLTVENNRAQEYVDKYWTGHPLDGYDVFIQYLDAYENQVSALLRISAQMVITAMNGGSQQEAANTLRECRDNAATFPYIVRLGQFHISFPSYEDIRDEGIRLMRSGYGVDMVTAMHEKNSSMLKRDNYLAGGAGSGEATAQQPVRSQAAIDAQLKSIQEAYQGDPEGYDTAVENYYAALNGGTSVASVDDGGNDEGETMVASKVDESASTETLVLSDRDIDEGVYQSIKDRVTERLNERLASMTTAERADARGLLRLQEQGKLDEYLRGVFSGNVSNEIAVSMESSEGGYNAFYLIDGDLKIVDNVGHAGVLMGSESEGWYYFSFGIGTTKGNAFTNDGNLAVEFFTTLREAQNDLDRYSHYIHWNVNNSTDIRSAIFEASKHLNDKYNLLTNNCDDIAADIIRAAGIDLEDSWIPNVTYLNEYYSGGDTNSWKDYIDLHNE